MGSKVAQSQLGPQATQQSLGPGRAPPTHPAPLVSRHPLLQAQQGLGNQGVQLLLRAGLIQAKLRMSPPNDPSEAEADRKADAALNMPVRVPDDAPTPEVAGHRTSPGMLGTTGWPLPEGVRQQFAQPFGRDFHDVRIHTGAWADGMTRDIDALAFTVGSDIVFGAGQWAPETGAGLHLLGHELAHTVQQERGPLRVQRQERTTGARCAQTYTRAQNFQQLVDLVQAAETSLIACGYTSVEDRIHILRGIYYGTTWSMDYQVEQSTARNIAFQGYTVSTVPDDPRSCLTCGLFEALRGSAEVVDGNRRVDVGHLIIGLDARRSWSARNVSVPTQGGTGLEITTWLGDLGGGAGMLSYRRTQNPATSVSQVFRGSDFGGAINLEGDIAAYIVARDTTTTDSSAPVMASGGTIADALAAYLTPGHSGPEWNQRCATFLGMIGGQVDATGHLTNRSTLITDLEGQIRQFGAWYLVNRLRQTNRLNRAVLLLAAQHIVGAANEVATVFVDILSNCLEHPGSRLQLQGAAPSPTPPGPEWWPLRLLVDAADTAQEVKQGVEDAYDGATDWLRRHSPW